MRIRDEKELKKLLPDGLRKEYAVGIHGFDGDYWVQDDEGHYSLDSGKIEKAKQDILRDGLRFSKSRILLSTVRFSNLSSYVSTREYYDAGGIIVALPSVLKSDKGRTMFLGKPNEEAMKNTHWDRNREPISLSEVLLADEGRLDPKFILGTYTKGEDGIEVTLNSNHMAFQNNGLVSEEFIAEKEARLREMLRQGEISQDVVEEVARQRQAATVKTNTGMTGFGKIAYGHLGKAAAQKLEGGFNSIMARVRREKDNKSSER